MLTDDEIARLGYASGLLARQDVTFTKRQDGINVEYPVLEVSLFARAVEAAAYEKAAQACEQRVTNEPGLQREDYENRQRAADIRALAQAKEA